MDKSQKIKKFVEELNKPDKKIPLSVKEIPNFPFNSFEELKASKDFLLQRFSSGKSVFLFNTLSNKLEKLYSNFLLILIPVVVIFSLYVMFKYSFLLLLIAPLLLIPVIVVKGKVYDKVILTHCLDSEMIFCCLYYYKQICLTTLNNEKSYHWGLYPKPEHQNYNEQVLMTNKLVLEKLLSSLPYKLGTFTENLESNMINLWTIHTLAYSYALLTLIEFSKDHKFLLSEKHVELKGATFRQMQAVDSEINMPPEVEIDRGKSNAFLRDALSQASKASASFMANMGKGEKFPDKDLIMFMISIMGYDQDTGKETIVEMRDFNRSFLAADFQRKKAS